MNKLSLTNLFGQLTLASGTAAATAKINGNAPR
jgi:hypothetical protein